MLTALPFAVAYVLSLAGDDTLNKKKAGLPHPPAKSATGAPTSASTVIARAAAQTIARFAGSSTESSIAGVAHEAAPRATYLRAALASHLPAPRATRGPELPARFKSEANASMISADSIVVEKARRTMTLYSEGAPVRIYFVALGKNPVGHKVARGDYRTPEGIYHIAAHNPDSKYHLSLLVSYPNEHDLVEAKKRGVATGGEIMIHGLPDRFASYGSAHRQWDWTKGCIAVTNAEIEEIWSAIPDGAAIQIKP